MNSTPKIHNLEIISNDENLRLELTATLTTGQRFSVFMQAPILATDLAMSLHHAGKKLHNQITEELQDAK